MNKNNYFTGCQNLYLKKFFDKGSLLKKKCQIITCNHNKVKMYYCFNKDKTICQYYLENYSQKILFLQSVTFFKNKVCFYGNIVLGNTFCSSYISLPKIYTLDVFKILELSGHLSNFKSKKQLSKLLICLKLVT